MRPIIAATQTMMPPTLGHLKLSKPPMIMTTPRPTSTCTPESQSA